MTFDAVAMALAAAVRRGFDAARLVERGAEAGAAGEDDALPVLALRGQLKICRASRTHPDAVGVRDLGAVGPLSE